MPEPKTYDLGGGFALVEAESAEFARFHAVYRVDPFLRDEAKALLAMFCDGAPCHWVTLDGKRVGGCLAGDGVLGNFFTIPPFEQRGEMIRHVAHHLLKDEDRVFAHEVMMEELDDYFKLGFRLTASLAHTLSSEWLDYSWQFMRVMVRPTEVLPPVDCDVTLRPPRKTDAGRIGFLLRDAYGTSDPMRLTADDFYDDVLDVFQQKDRATRAASSVAIKDDRIVGACLIVRWEGSPLLFDIAVHPKNRREGIARAMLTRALSELNNAGEYRLRLFVECGNPAEALYHAMGFLPGPKTTSMILE
jgi:ribosomal protein S18 acetylase RimI-like enzyme